LDVAKKRKFECRKGGESGRLLNTVSGVGYDRSWHKLALSGLAGAASWMTANGSKADRELR